MARWNLRRELPALLAEVKGTPELSELAALRDTDLDSLTRQMGNAVRTFSNPTKETAEAVVRDLTYIAQTMLENYELTPTSIPVHDPNNRINGYDAMYGTLIGAGAIMNGDAPGFYHQMAEYVRRDVEAAAGDSFVLVPRFVGLVLEPIRRNGTKKDILNALELMDQFNTRPAEEIIPHRWTGSNERTSTPKAVAYATSRRLGQSLCPEIDTC